MSGANLVNTPGYYYAAAYWLAALLYSFYLKKKGTLRKRWCIRVLIFVPLLGFMIATNGVPKILFLPCMVVSLLLVFVMMYNTCDAGLAETSYYCARAFVLGEFTASFGWQIFYYASGIWGGFLHPACNLLLEVLIYGSVLWIAGRLEKRFERENEVIEIGKKELLPLMVIVVIVYAVSNLSYLYSNTPFSSAFSFEVFIIRTMADLGGVAILYAYHTLLVEQQYRFETMNLQNMLDIQYTNYQMSEQSVNLVNQKYHDLKHQIAILRAGAISNQDMTAYLDVMEEEIKSYEAQNKTGNRVLDTILTGKSLYCQKREIQLACVADGAALNFMDTMDLSALFGNILDNAIENTEKVKDPQKRLIHLTITTQKEFLRIRMENYFDGELKLKNGVPVTTKKEKGYHGYGIKSVKSIVGKYGGSVTIEVQEHWFELRILIPLAQSRGKTGNSK